MEEEILYEIRVKKVICVIGGVLGLYKFNNLGFLRYKMWYFFFNIGVGYVMGIKVGVEMIIFEMRFIVLRCKDIIVFIGIIV